MPSCDSPDSTTLCMKAVHLKMSSGWTKVWNGLPVTSSMGWPRRGVQLGEIKVKIPSGVIVKMISWLFSTR